METVWQINTDRYGDESRAKSGILYSIAETAELLIDAYAKAGSQGIKPKIVIVSAGLGIALYDYLQDKEIPCVKLDVIISRLGSADILKYKARD